MIDQIFNITTFIIVLISASFGIIVYILLKNIRKAKYLNDEQRVLLEGIRYSLESQIYNLNDRLIKHEERWRDVNHLLYSQNNLVVDHKYPKTTKVGYTNFLEANGIVQNDLLIDDNLIFVLTPFHDQFYEDYKVIKETCTDIGYNCKRGDEVKITGDIFPEMLKLIIKSKLIIANVNGRNPNVLYELGIAHALDKQVILIAKGPSDLPADIKSKRFLIYSTYNELQNKLRQELFDYFK